jgi:hypothetical protein
VLCLFVFVLIIQIKPLKKSSQYSNLTIRFHFIKRKKKGPSIAFKYQLNFIIINLLFFFITNISIKSERIKREKKKKQTNKDKDRIE